MIHRFAASFAALLCLTPIVTSAADDRPAALEPAAAVDSFVLHPDCRIELVAAEPDVVDPVAIAFDPHGRLWVVEMSDYPTGPEEGQPPKSRIRILTDDDGDGRFTNPVTFADGLLFANGLQLWKEGAIVTASGEVLYLADTDGDLKADVREVWFKGFTEENSQLRANHPTLGIDNKIYVASGLRGGTIEAVKPEWQDLNEPIPIQGKDFRFDPLTGKAEAITGVGQFGLTFDDWGNRFLCSNRNPCMHVVFEEEDLKLAPKIPVAKVVNDVSPPAEQSRIYGITPGWTTSTLHAGQFTAACGVTIYRGSLLPEEFRGNSFTCEPTANVVHRDVLIPDGPTFKSHYGREGVEFLASKDSWYRPVNLSNGPDGALYIVDMYRAVIEHPQFMPDELKTRSDLTDGNDRGRIWRIVPTESSAKRQIAIEDQESQELVKLLENENSWQRETAARLLLERQDEAVIPLLEKMIGGQFTDLVNYHAVSLLDGMGVLSFKHPASAVYRGKQPPRDTSEEISRMVGKVYRLASLRFPNELGEVLSMSGTPSRESHRPQNFGVPFELALALRRSDTQPRLGKLAWMLQTRDCTPWLVTAVAIAADEQIVDVLTEYWQAKFVDKRQIGKADRETIRQLAEFTGIRAESGAIRQFLDRLTAIDPKSNDLSDDHRRALLAALAGLFKGIEQRRDQAEFDIGGERLIFFLIAIAEMASDTDRPLEVRHDAIAILKGLPGDATTRSLRSIINAKSPQSLRVAAIESMNPHADDQTIQDWLDRLSSETPAVQSALLTAILSSGDRTKSLLDRIDAGDLSARIIDPTRAARLMRHRDADIQTRAKKLFGASDADRQKVVAQYTPALEQKSDPLIGRTLFTKNCAICHKIGDVGVNVAPDIADSRTRTPQQLLTNILDPNRAIDNNYFSYTLVETDGKVHTGIIAAETATSVTLKQAEGKSVTVLRADIDELSCNNVSLMPVGFEKTIPPKEMADIVSFIKNWRYLDGAVPEDVIR